MSDSTDYLLMQMFVMQIEVTAENLKKLYGLKDKDIERILDRHLTADKK